MTEYAFTLPFALSGGDVHIILAQRQLIQKRTGGETITGTIPEWAGQWGLIGGPLNTGESAQDACVRTFKAQTGLDLSDADVQANFTLSNRNLLSLTTADYNPFNVLGVFTTMGGLNLVQSVIADTIGTAQVDDYTLSGVEVQSVTNARKKLGPTPPPSTGWQEYLVQNYYGGKAPGQFNTDIDALTTQITTNAAQDNGYVTTALSDTGPA